MKIIEKIVDIQTGEETIIERDATAQEIAEHQAFEAAFAAKAAEQAAKAQARQDLLDRLGITEEEAKLLLGGN